MAPSCEDDYRETVSAELADHGMRPKILCQATTKRGTPCQCKAIETKRGAWRCKLHGGLSSGPKTPEGRARIAAAQRVPEGRYAGLLVTGEKLSSLAAARATRLPNDTTRPDWFDPLFYFPTQYARARALVMES